MCSDSSMSSNCVFNESLKWTDRWSPGSIWYYPPCIWIFELGSGPSICGMHLISCMLNSRCAIHNALTFMYSSIWESSGNFNGFEFLFFLRCIFQPDFFWFPWKSMRWYIFAWIQPSIIFRSTYGMLYIRAATPGSPSIDLHVRFLRLRIGLVPLARDDVDVHQALNMANLQMDVHRVQVKMILSKK